MALTIIDDSAADTKSDDMSNTVVFEPMLQTPNCDTSQSSKRDDIKPIMLFILIAITSTFSGGYEFYIVNTAMRQFQIFVNNSMAINYSLELSDGQLDLLWVLALATAAIGYMCGHLLAPFLVENFGRKGILFI